VDSFTFLAKAVRPLPEKFHGLQDQEDIYRKRYLDMTMNPESYQRFLFKSRFYKALREFYYQEGFVEIQTPILDNAASGAAAKPFITHHNDYDNDVYLRIAFETSLKKSTVGRFEKVFEIGQDFRNEGSDPSHLQEFTQVEHYAVYWNYEDNMKYTEKMFDHLFEVLGLPKILKVKDKD
jgi:lysyl-tRNA synthetase class 2